MSEMEELLLNTRFGKVFAKSTGDRSAPLILAIHGWSRRNGWHTWEPLMAPMAAAGYRVVSVDMPGWGQSLPATPGTLSIEDAVSMAIDLHLRLLDSRRGSVERAQVARAVLHRIASDLRGAIGPATTDFSGITEMLSSAASGGLDMGALGDAAGAAGDAGDAGSDLGDLAGAAGASDLGQAASDLADAAADLGLDVSDTGATQDIASTTTPPAVPGLYGNQYQLQVDVSRIPRVDEFQRMRSPDALFKIQDIPSDVKTIAYYYRSVDNTTATTATSNRFGGSTKERTGLVRRVLDRAVTLQASETGGLTGVEDVGEVIAPEVTAIQFEYFDGMQWVYEWDSEEMGGLPMAVRIPLSVSTAQATEETSSPLLSGTNTLQTGTDMIYSLVVRLPTAKPIEETESTDASGLESVGL